MLLWRTTGGNYRVECRAVCGNAHSRPTATMLVIDSGQRRARLFPSICQAPLWKVQSESTLEIQIPSSGGSSYGPF